VGVIVGKDGTILIAKRPDKTHQGGLWEFPGGKVERGEVLFDALRRELCEELDIDIISTEPLIKIRHDYGDKIVLLDVHKVTNFSGEAKGNEGQPIAWVVPRDLHQYQFPAANRPIIAALHLPSRLLITGNFHNVTDFFERLEFALERGIKLVQLRVKDSDLTSFLVKHAVKLCEQYAATLLINTSPEKFAEISFQAKQAGLHLNSQNLLSCDRRPVDKDVFLSASCHNEKEIEHAQKIGVDFMCVSPVAATQSHPGQWAMGWEAFEKLVEKATMPVFALGGMKETDLRVAVARGAQGIAAISEWW